MPQITETPVLLWTLPLSRQDGIYFLERADVHNSTWPEGKCGLETAEVPAGGEYQLHRMATGRLTNRYCDTAQEPQGSNRGQAVTEVFAVCSCF